MRFWDTSALVPLLTQEDATAEMTALFATDRNLVVAFITPVEIASALTRKAGVNDDLRRLAERRLAVLEANWRIIDEYEPAMKIAQRFASTYRLRAGDAIQLACATLATADRSGLPFVVRDHDLAAAARAEGFPILP